MTGRPTPLLLVASGRRNPHAVMLMAVAVILGVSYLAGAPRPGSVNDALPGPVFYAWAVALLLTGTAGLWGSLTRDTQTGLELERGAMIAQTGALLLYGTVAVTYAGFGALISALIVTGWAIANTVRAVQITRDLRRARR
ncbi:hypothetical protein [Micromonospora aurantiaca (nom. illeg.)]|uniref:hypothetical protein n=1 Tax=Micromonospora aurantiaca (nom. illeg.) TaxID=47850 RepID=UPI003F4A1E67